MYRCRWRCKCSTATAHCPNKCVGKSEALQAHSNTCVIRFCRKYLVVDRRQMRWVRGDFIGLTTLIANAILVQQLVRFGSCATFATRTIVAFQSDKGTTDEFAQSAADARRNNACCERVLAEAAPEHNRVAGHAASYINSHRPRVITGWTNAAS